MINKHTDTLCQMVANAQKQNKVNRIMRIEPAGKGVYCLACFMGVFLFTLILFLAKFKKGKCASEWFRFL